MQSRWDDSEAARLQDSAGPDPADRELALRVYTSRLIGADPDLVMHGGGNTSVKLVRRDVLGDQVDVLHVKGSGWDLGTIEAPGLPAVRLSPLLELRRLTSLSDEDMVAAQRTNLLDPSSPNPSVETLLHAFLPHRYVDHTHATAMLAIADQPAVHDICREIFGDRVALVDYVMPGFDLAKKAAEVFEASPDVEGMLLIRHGHFTFGPDAKTSYERMIAHVSAVEEYIASRRPAPSGSDTADSDAYEKATLGAGTVLPAIRAALASDGGPAPVLDLRSTPRARAFLARDDLDALSTRGVATPDHVIRTKRFPVVIRPEADSPAVMITSAVADFRAAYRTYFDRQVARLGEERVMLDPSPRVFWIPGLGVVGAGADAKAAGIAADLAEQTLRVVDAAEAVGEYSPVGEDDTFDMEYWSLEQAKLGKKVPPPLAGRVVLITGAAGAIGAATARAFRGQGAELMLVDRDAGALDDLADSLGSARFACDLTDTATAAGAVEACVVAFGGVDIVVSNAGAAWTGEIADVDEAVLRESFELNFWSHQRLAAAAVRVMRAQGQGGCLLFNVSKQAVNQGARFGPYGLPKAALFALVKQYAVDCGADGIRSNGVNADRIRSGLLDDAMIAGRAAARGVSTEEYMAGNLLHAEVRAHDVAKAFVALARAERTTAHMLTVDGGNVAASLR